jgi:succinate dehydrogenase/fumarate reductase flavoprotein subunit
MVSRDAIVIGCGNAGLTATATLQLFQLILLNLNAVQKTGRLLWMAYLS